MSGPYEGGGEIGKGGFFVHYRDTYNRCEWAFVTAAHKGGLLNLKVLPNDPDQTLWKPRTEHGTCKGEWHHPDQCSMTAQQMREDEQRVLAASK